MFFINLYIFYSFKFENYCDHVVSNTFLEELKTDPLYGAEDAFGSRPVAFGTMTLKSSAAQADRESMMDTGLFLLQLVFSLSDYAYCVRMYE